jgi:hypothetical protein
MVAREDPYRENAKQCCLNAVVAQDISHSTHWLEAAARWLEFGRQAGEVQSANGVVVLKQSHGKKD